MFCFNLEEDIGCTSSCRDEAEDKDKISWLKFTGCFWKCQTEYQNKNITFQVNSVNSGYRRENVLQEKVPSYIT